MGSRMTAKELLSAVAATGYFASPETKQELFRQVVENRLNISLGRAIDLLTKGGLATFDYVRSPTTHPRDILDTWQLRLTSAGESALSSKL